MLICEKPIPGKREKSVKHCFFAKKIILRKKTKFHEVLIFENPLYKRVFLLNGIVQLSQFDEFIYHEMMVHPVLFSHPFPKKILILGGGDGGVLREVLKHKVKSVDLVEIDRQIIEISKKYLKFCCKNSFSDKRVKIFNLPAQKFIQKVNKKYEIIISDCTNFGEKISKPLFSLNFYSKIYEILSPSGIFVTLGSSFLDFENILKEIFKKMKKIFEKVFCIRFCVPSFHCGEYAFLVGSKKIDLSKVNFSLLCKKYEKLRKKLKYYSPEIHKSSFVLPKIWQLK